MTPAETSDPGRDERLRVTESGARWPVLLPGRPGAAGAAAASNLKAKPWLRLGHKVTVQVCACGPFKLNVIVIVIKAGIPRAASGVQPIAGEASLPVMNEESSPAFCAVNASGSARLPVTRIQGEAGTCSALRVRARGSRTIRDVPASVCPRLPRCASICRRSDYKIAVRSHSFLDSSNHSYYSNRLWHNCGGTTALSFPKGNLNR